MPYTVAAHNLNFKEAVPEINQEDIQDRILVAE
jgi:hypothetical protein